MLTNFFNGIRAAAGSSLGITNLDVNDAVPQSPSSPDLPPNPFLEESPPATKTSRVVIDLSSPTKPSSRSLRKESHSEMSRPRVPKTQRSADEKRLVGDYTPADAVSIPDPSTWIPATRRTMTAKPGSNSGFKPMDTLNAGPHAPNRKPTTYGKHDRPRPSLIGGARGAGQIAYLNQREEKVPATPPRYASTREDHDQRSGGAMSGKRRKTGPVITLDDDDDEVLEISRSDHNLPVGTSQDRPRSARSLYSQMSIGSESTTGDFKPSAITSEFREADNLLRPSQKKSRRSCSNTCKGGGGRASTSPGAHLARQVILQELQQGEAKQDPARHESRVDPVTSHFFPNARINESTSDQAGEKQRANVQSEYLRMQHKPAPKRAESIIDSYSADELAISPKQKERKSISKQRQAANSGAKRNTRDRALHDVWQLSFARSYDYDGSSPTLNNSHSALVLRNNLPDGWQVQIFDPIEDSYRTRFLINPKDVNKVLADDTGHIRLEGPRKPDGNSDVFDVGFVNLAEFRLFRDRYAASVTPTGKFHSKPEEHMLRLFQSPLRPKNAKVGTSELVPDRSAPTEHNHRQGDGTPKTTIVNQMKRAAQESRIDSRPMVATRSTTSTRPSRSRRLAPVHDVEDTPEESNVSKFSVDKGLGERWAKSLEYGEGRQRAIVHFDDLPRLDEEEFLNDSLIDFYMIYLFKQLKVPTDKVYFFNTYFFTKLTEHSGRKSIDYKAVERWTSKIDIFSYDYIVVPINEQAHWYLAIICNMSKIKRKPIVQDFDEPPSNVPDQASLAVMAATPTESKGDTAQKPTSLAEPAVLVEEALDQPNDEEPNLFDETVLSLVDRDDTGTETPHESETTPAESVRQSPEAKSLVVTQTTSDARDTHAGILSQSQFMASSSTRKKAKRRPIPKRDPDQPVIIVLDSLGGNARTGAVRALKDWIAAEGLARRGMEAVIKENGYYPKSTQVPMQNNFTDCGVYLLGYVEKFFQNPDDFKNKLLTGSMSAQEDWPELDPSEMRNKMRQIIFDCYRKQEDDRKAQRKAKKGSENSKTSPTPMTHEAGDMGGRKSEELRGGRTKLDLSLRHEGAQPASSRPNSPTRSPTRLSSPFSFDTQRTPSTKQSHQAAVSKVSDSPPVFTSPVKQAIGAPRPEAITRRHSPEVRISSKTPQSNRSMRNGQSTSDGSPLLTRALNRTGHVPDTSSPKKRQRQDDDNDQTKSPTAKRHFIRSPQLRQDKNEESVQAASRSCEGSGPNVPIEIDDSQEAKTDNTNHHQRRHVSSPSARHKRSSRPKQTLHPSPTFDEIPVLSFSHATSGHGRYEGSSVDHALRRKLDEDDYARENARHSRAPAPSDANGSLEHREEEGSDPMEGISQSTHNLQLDGVNDGSVVRETPEPDVRSAALQNGWSRDDPLLL